MNIRTCVRRSRMSRMNESKRLNEWMKNLMSQYPQCARHAYVVINQPTKTNQAPIRNTVFRVGGTRKNWCGRQRARVRMCGAAHHFVIAEIDAIDAHGAWWPFIANADRSVWPDACPPASNSNAKTRHAPLQRGVTITIEFEYSHSDKWPCTRVHRVDGEWWIVWAASTTTKTHWPCIWKAHSCLCTEHILNQLNNIYDIDSNAACQLSILALRADVYWRRYCIRYGIHFSIQPIYIYSIISTCCQIHINIHRTKWKYWFILHTRHSKFSVNRWMNKLAEWRAVTCAIIHAQCAYVAHF